MLSALSVTTGAFAACPNESVPGFRAFLPDCRAYELVSPGYKEGYPIFVAGLAENGSQIHAESFGSFANTENTSVFGQSYSIVRTKTGWVASPLDAPFSQFPSYRVQGMGSDFQSSLWFADKPGQFSRDVYLDRPPGSLIRIGPGAPPGALRGELRYVGASDDLRHVILLDHSPNGGEEDRLWPGDTTIGGRQPSLYEYEGTGNSEPRLVGVSNVGVPASVADGKLISNCGTALGSIPAGEAYNAVSANGDAVFFTAEACGGFPAVNEVYARIGGKRTVAISEPPPSGPGWECTGGCASAEHRPGVFAGAARDGSKVFFITSQPLVNGDVDNGFDLYEAEIREGVVVRLVQVSHGDADDPTPGLGANVLGVARVSEDGSHVYFVAEGALTAANPEGKAPIAGEPNLYVAVRACEDGTATCESPVEHISFIATLSAQDGEDWSPVDVRPVQVTPPNGRFLIFQSASDLTADEEGHEEAGQLFEYDARTKVLVRVSRGEHGYNEDGNTKTYSATIPIQFYTGSKPEERFTQLAVSVDGSRVFFSSYDALTSQALGGFNNVYEYYGGKVSLISDGHDVSSVEGRPATQLIGTDESGRDVFFTTADSLVPQPGDTLTGVYDARSEGGFPQVVEPAQCLGASCRSGSGTLLPSASATPSPVSEGARPEPGTSPSAKPKAKAKTGKKHNRKKGKGKKRRAKKTTGRRK